MPDSRGRQPASSEGTHALTCYPRPLASAPKRVGPRPNNRQPESAEPYGVGWHGVVREVSTHHATQPLPLLEHRLMHPLPQFRTDLLQLRLHAFSYCPSNQQEPTPPRLPADVREAEEVEGPCSPASLLATSGSIPPEANKSGLFGM
jgi:hypothetical protein